MMIQWLLRPDTPLTSRPQCIANHHHLRHHHHHHHLCLYLHHYHHHHHHHHHHRRHHHHHHHYHCHYHRHYHYHRDHHFSTSAHNPHYHHFQPSSLPSPSRGISISCCQCHLTFTSVHSCLLSFLSPCHHRRYLHGPSPSPSQQDSFSQIRRS